MATPTFYHRHHHHSISRFSKQQLKHQAPSHSRQFMITPIQTHHQNPLQPCKFFPPFLGFLNLYLFSHFFCFFAPLLHLGSDQWDPSPPHSATVVSFAPLTPAASRMLFVGERTVLFHHHHRLQPLPISTAFPQWQLCLVVKVIYVVF